MAFVNLGQVMYPVGSYYISNEPTSPGDLFGGQWLEIENKFLYASKGKSLVEGGTAQHKHGISYSYIPYWGILCASSNSSPDETYMFIGDNIKIESKEASPWGHSVNAATRNGWQTVNNPRVIKAVGNSRNTETLPPYITCHMWYRIS